MHTCMLTHIHGQIQDSEFIFGGNLEIKVKHIMRRASTVNIQLQGKKGRKCDILQHQWL